jgi:hypothetical protein
VAFRPEYSSLTKNKTSADTTQKTSLAMPAKLYAITSNISPQLRKPSLSRNSRSECQ